MKLTVMQTKNFTSNGIFGKTEKTTITSQEFIFKNIKYCIQAEFLQFESNKNFDKIVGHKDFEKTLNETLKKLAKQYSHHTLDTEWIFNIMFISQIDKSLFISCYGLN